LDGLLAYELKHVGQCLPQAMHLIQKVQDYAYTLVIDTQVLS
jgi:hypothetical protein